MRIGSGSLIAEDVRLGEEGARSQGSRDLEIGRGAIIRAGTEVHRGVQIGDRLNTGRNVLISEDTSIGDDCRVSSNTVIESGCTIGDRVRIGVNCYIAQFTTIADDVGIAPGVCLTSDPHPGSETRLCMRGPTIEQGVQIGMNATIFPFVTVGARSLVDAGSVVTRDVPSEHVVAGNPARIVGPVADVTCPLDLEEGDYLQVPEQRESRASGQRQRSPLQSPALPALPTRLPRDSPRGAPRHSSVDVASMTPVSDG